MLLCKDHIIVLTLWWSNVAAAAKGDGGNPGGACPRRSIASAKLCPEETTPWFISGESIIISFS